MADFYCPDLRGQILAAADGCGIKIRPSGTIVVINGPRLSSKAESRSLMREGFDVINMTQYPECYLARELGICYANATLITDYDIGVASQIDFRMPEMSAIFDSNIYKLKEIAFSFVRNFKYPDFCGCASNLESALVSGRVPSMNMEVYE
jgi:5'-methylthioadenosine phosphorylase